MCAHVIAAADTALEDPDAAGGVASWTGPASVVGQPGPMAPLPEMCVVSAGVPV